MTKKNQIQENDQSAGSARLRNLRHEHFCQVYAGTCWGNSSRAYKEAFRVKSSDVAKANGPRLMRRPDVKERIAYLREQNYELIKMDRAEAVMLLGDFARARIQDFVQADGSLKIHGVPHERAVREVEVTETVTGKGEDKVPRRVTKIKLHNPIDAIANIAKIADLNAPEHKVLDESDGLTSILNAIDGKSRGIPMP